MLCFFALFCKLLGILFSMWSVILSANKDSFISFFPIWMPFIYFYFLIAVGRTSSTMLSKSGESRLPSLIPELRKCPVLTIKCDHSFRFFVDALFEIYLYS